jgi:diguanylate cyclase (GGDEF)-like protein/PAS domain S-box-containing protein
VLGESNRFSASRLLGLSRPGKQGMVFGLDADGSEVLGAYHPVGATDWLVMAMTAQRTVMAPLRRFVMWVTLAALAAMIPLMSATFYMHRRDRRRTRDALVAAGAEKGRLLQAFHDMPFTGIAMFCARTGRPVNVNAYLCHLLGRSEDELLACRWKDLLHPDDRRGDPLRLRLLLAGDVAGSQAELRVLHRDGTVIYAAIHVQCLVDEAGVPEYFIASIQDVSERRSYEEALREREADLNRAQHIARVGSWTLDVHRNVLTWSPECYRIFGMPPGEQLTYERFLDCVHDEDRQLVNDAWNRAMNGEKYDMDHRIVVGGEVKWIRERADLAFDEHGNLIAGIGTAQDITEQHLSSERLRQAAMVFERSGDGIIVTDAKRRITIVNPALCRMMGYEESEVLGNTPEMFRSGRHGADFYRSLWRGLRETGHWRSEVWDRRKNGEIFPSLLSISALRDKNSRITGYVGVFTDISRLKASEAKLAHLAHHDALTGLPNRLLMRTRLEHSIDVSTRRGGGLALLMLDLDGFGGINDSYGHLAGDELLRQAAGRLRRCVRSADTVARFSGDEFCILLEDINGVGEVTRIGSKIIEQLAAPLRLSNGSEVRIGVSIGVSLCPEHGRTTEVLLQQADAALYRAKAEGHGRLRFYSDEMTEESRGRVEMQSQLHRAFDAGQLQVHYQPQVDVASGRIVGAEALLRWNDPERGLMPTAEWIALAEETGMIANIGGWALREVCAQGRCWLDEGMPSLTLAVNLSPRQLLHSNVCELVEQVLKDTGFPPECLEFELTETAIMTHADEAERTLRRLRDSGIRLAIDDFGTGYSSLAHLKRFPLDVLKIDRRFIEGIPDDPSDCELVRAIVAMGQALHLKVLAEGVETERQLAFLMALGCDRYQGYLRSPALAPEEFERLLRVS